MSFTNPPQKNSPCETFENFKKIEIPKSLQKQSFSPLCYGKLCQFLKLCEQYVGQKRTKTINDLGNFPQIQQNFLFATVTTVTSYNPPQTILTESVLSCVCRTTFSIDFERELDQFLEQKQASNIFPKWAEPQCL